MTEFDSCLPFPGAFAKNDRTAYLVSIVSKLYPTKESYETFIDSFKAYESSTNLTGRQNCRKNSSIPIFIVVAKF